MANPAGGVWSAGQFWGWGIGGGIGAAIPAVPQLAVLKWPELVPLVTSFVPILTIAGGLAGGLLGYEVSFLLDDPFGTSRPFRAALLFSLTFTMLIYSLLSFPILPFVFGGAPVREHLLALAAFLSALIAGCLKGVLNNLRTETEHPFSNDDEYRNRLSN
jgi:hypothetical protein